MPKKKTFKSDRKINKKKRISKKIARGGSLKRKALKPKTFKRKLLKKKTKRKGRRLRNTIKQRGGADLDFFDEENQTEFLIRQPTRLKKGDIGYTIEDKGNIGWKYAIIFSPNPNPNPNPNTDTFLIGFVGDKEFAIKVKGPFPKREEIQSKINRLLNIGKKNKTGLLEFLKEIDAKNLLARLNDKSVHNGGDQGGNQGGSDQQLQGNEGGSDQQLQGNEDSIQGGNQGENTYMEPVNNNPEHVSVENHYQDIDVPSGLPLTATDNVHEYEYQHTDARVNNLVGFIKDIDTTNLVGFKKYIDTTKKAEEKKLKHKEYFLFKEKDELKFSVKIDRYYGKKGTIGSIPPPPHTLKDIDLNVYVKKHIIKIYNKKKRRKKNYITIDQLIVYNDDQSTEDEAHDNDDIDDQGNGYQTYDNGDSAGAIPSTNTAANPAMYEKLYVETAGAPATSAGNGVPMYAVLADDQGGDNGTAPQAIEFVNDQIGAATSSAPASASSGNAKEATEVVYEGKPLANDNVYENIVNGQVAPF